MLRKAKLFNSGALMLVCAAIVTCLSLPVSAASNILNLTNVEVVDTSSTVTVGSTEFSDNTLSGKIHFEHLNDSATLALTLENASDTTYMIGGVSDNLTENYLTAEYDFDDENEIAPGETTTLKVVLTYANEKAGASSFKINDYVITISLLSEDGEAEAVINPGTRDNIVDSVVLVAVVSALAITALVFVKNKRAKVLVAVFALSSTIMLPAVINAKKANEVEIKIDSISFGDRTLSSITTMQEMTSDICSASATGETNTLKDTRENGINSYIVGKAADGKCWMLQNLRLGSTVATGGSITVDKVINETGAVDGTFELAGKVAADSGFTSSINNGYDNTNDESQFACNEDYGCYYNWTAATAGTGLSSLTTGEASGSICPKGWSLPTKDAQSDLMFAYSPHSSRFVTDTTNSEGAIPGLTLGGSYGSSGRRNNGTYADYWSSTAYNYIAGSARVIELNTTSLIVYDFYSKSAGLAVRCIAL